MADDKSGLHWSWWSGIMYNKIPVGVILVVLLVGLKAWSGYGSLSEAEQRHNAGLELFEQGHLEEAIAEYDEAIRLEPRTFIVYYYRGIAYHALGQLERAIEDLNEAIRLDPKYALTYSARGNSYRHLGEYQRAIEDYDEAIRLDSQQRAYYYYLRALSYIYLNRDVEAEQDAERAIELGAERGILEAAIEEAKEKR